jgi:hypothetical protein
MVLLLLSSHGLVARCSGIASHGIAASHGLVTSRSKIASSCVVASLDIPVIVASSSAVFGTSYGVSANVVARNMLNAIIVLLLAPQLMLLLQL